MALVAAVVTLGGPAVAAWRDDITVLRVGILGGNEAAYRIAAIEPFRAYLERKVGIPVEIVATDTYDALIEAQATGGVEYAIYSATAYATAAVGCQCVEAFAAPTAADGALGFHAVLTARSGNDIADLADARGKRLGLGFANSVGTSIVPRHALAAEGIDPATYFLSISEYSAPEEAVTALLSGEIDIAAAWSSMTGSRDGGYDFGTFADMVGEGTLSMDRVRIIWQSGLIPFGPHALRTNVPSELRGILSGALLSMVYDDPAALDAVDRLSFGGGGFVTPDASLYATVMSLVSPPEGN